MHNDKNHTSDNAPKALFVEHRAKPGQRDKMRAVWERYVKRHAAANPDHLAYCFCDDDADPDVIRVFQLYRTEAAAKAFLAQPWYPEYLKEVGEFIVHAPKLTTATPRWTKP